MKRKIFICVVILVIILILSMFIIFKKSKSTDFANLNEPDKLSNLDNDEPIDNLKTLDDLSDDELIEFSNSGNNFPNGFIDSKLNDYERIINSSDSTEEAQNAVLEEFNSNNKSYTNKVTKNNLILQTDNYYGLDVSWIYTNANGNSSTYSEKVISFKKSIYDNQNNIFYSKDKEIIEEVLNLIYYMDYYNDSGSQVLQSTISETSDCFEYTIYYLERVYGDWGINDVLHFQKDIVKVNKVTGEINSTDSIEIKKVEILGTAPSIDW